MFKRERSNPWREVLNEPEGVDLNVSCRVSFELEEHSVGRQTLVK